jgi:hypothetical protein
MEPAKVLIHVRAKNFGTSVPVPDTTVKVDYFRCILFAYAVKPLAEGTSGPDGSFPVAVDERERTIVQFVACPGDAIILGTIISLLLRHPSDEVGRSNDFVSIW